MNEQEAVLATREYFAALCSACIAQASQGEIRVNDLPSYVAWQERLRTELLAGDYDHTFTSRQYVHFLMTGKCVALLP